MKKIIAINDQAFLISLTFPVKEPTPARSLLGFGRGKLCCRHPLVEMSIQPESTRRLPDAHLERVTCRRMCHHVYIIISAPRDPPGPTLAVVILRPELHRLSSVEVRRFAHGERCPVVTFTPPGKAHRQDLAFA